MTGNGRKWIALSVALLVLLTGCWQDTAYQTGFGYTFTPHQIMFGARMESDRFARDAVVLDIYFGVHDMGYAEKYGSDPKSGYLKDGNETVFFGLYLCAGEDKLDVVNDMQIPDYRSIPDHVFLREISQEDAFSAEYGFRMDYLRGITYNHMEKVTIPAEFLTGERGSFAVKLIAFHEPMESGEPYYTSTVGFIAFDYVQQPDGTIQIIF